MKLNLNHSVLPSTSLLASLESQDLEGQKVYQVKVVSVDSKDKKVLLEVNSDTSVRYNFVGDNTVKAGATIMFTAEGDVVQVTLPAEPATPAPQASSRRSPDKGFVNPRSEILDR